MLLPKAYYQIPLLEETEKREDLRRLRVCNYKPKSSWDVAAMILTMVSPPAK